MTERTAITSSQIGDPIEWAPRLADILDEQLRVCRRLQELSRSQGEHIRRGETGELMRVLGDRQGLIGRLTGLNAQMEPYRREWEWCMGRLGAEERGALEGAARELRRLVDEISASDEADRRELEVQRTAVADELSGLGRGRVALQAYGPRPGVPNPMFQDRSC